MDLFSYVKSQLSILDIVGEYVTLKKSGSYWKGFSPFKSERTASFTVSPHKEIYYCFSSGNGGDVIDFIAKMEQCTPLEAARYLIEKYHLNPPANLMSAQPLPERNEKHRYYQTCTLVAEWCTQQLHANPTAQNYLTQRQISSATQKLFSLGYFPRGSKAISSLIAHARTQSILVDDLLQAHVLMEGKQGYYSPFEERIVFPIADHLGNICAFGGRIFHPEDTRAKYYNSKEHAFFNKGTILFGMDRAKRYIQKHTTAFLVEGYTDCLAMAQAGIPHTVATLGTACTAEHLKYLSRYAEKLYVLYDGDTAGKQAILRLTQLCWNVNLELYVLELPENDDPSSYLAQHHTLEHLIPQAYDIFSFFINQTSVSFQAKSLQERLHVASHALETLALVNDPLKRDILLQQASEKFSIPFETLKHELRKPHTRRAYTPEESKPQAPAASSIPQEDELEKKILYAILNSGITLSPEEEAFLANSLSLPLRQLFTYVQEYKKNHPVFEFAHFFSTLSPEQRKIASNSAVILSEPLSPETFKMLLNHYQKVHWKRTIERIKGELTSAQKNGDEISLKSTLAELERLKSHMVARKVNEK